MRLHAPTPDTVIVRVAGPLIPSTMPFFMLRITQQLTRAVHVVIDLSSVDHLDEQTADCLRLLYGLAARRGVTIHVADAGRPTIGESLRAIQSDGVVGIPADAVVATLGIRSRTFARPRTPLLGSPGTPREPAERERA
ncbi:STAS domain-containing protein [Pseudonocardia nigra]|uniref:STAS domain-containing protein n=1 Tax=Pseudonocardia nigra TaxID=1921578 RepID=UPI001C600FA4|nr:STAS domain-containing protein [Pseudonocardia nigra]